MMFEEFNQCHANGFGAMAISARTDFPSAPPIRHPVRIGVTLQFKDGASSVLQPAVYAVPTGKILFLDHIFLQGTLPLNQRMSLVLGKPGTLLACVDVASHSFLHSESLQTASQSLSVHLHAGDRLAVGSRRNSKSGDSSVFEIIIIGHIVDISSI